MTRDELEDLACLDFTADRGADKAQETYKQRIRKLTRCSGGRSLPEVVERLRTYMPGWKTYFQLAQTPKVFRELEEWLRALQLKHWRRGSTMYRELLGPQLLEPPGADPHAGCCGRRSVRHSDRPYPDWCARQGAP